MEKLDESTKKQVKSIFQDLESLLDTLKDSEGNDDSEEALAYAEWMLKKAQLRYVEKNKQHKFPLLYRRVYWAHMGQNVGREEDKHRPVVIVKSEGKSPICYVVPLTSQRLGDEYWYHIDLEGFNNTALVEHFRTISKDRIDKPMWKAGKIADVSKEDMQKIHSEIKRMFTYPPKER